ncbi:hypothetical protein RvY_12966 [Ramazzottius varieornatus]|uniref:Uncharacterized protein n=1 Tax=Ramazzottius varieornatus TaxID=947166 RepID=A0A1D1VL97_RAMVA|nr:hypothetical protein RvY_12966 [Ramazzottius varieornatus]
MTYKEVRVRELLKVARHLNNAADVWKKVAALPEATRTQEDAKTKILAKVADFGTSRRARKPGTVTSSDMFHLLRNESENHMVRTAALNMKLDPIKVETALSESLSQAENLATEYEQKFKNIEYDKGNLEAKIKKREEEVERLQRRLHTIHKSK